ncbi:MAG: tetratricopeptide repeat protein [Nitrospirota bacterium]
MPKAIKKRVPEKAAATEVEVKDKLVSLRDTIKERQKAVLRYGATILVAIMAISGFLFYDHTSRKKARMLDYEAYKIYHNIYQKQPVNREEQYKRALDIFKRSYDKKKSLAVLFYIAGCYYELGRYDEALKTLKDFTQRYSKEERFVPLAYEKMAMAYLRKGDTKEAMKALEALYSIKGDIYKDFALMEYARLLEKEGRTEEAKKKYKELTTRFPNSPFSTEEKVKLSGKKEG